MFGSPIHCPAEFTQTLASGCYWRANKVKCEYPACAAVCTDGTHLLIRIAMAVPV